MPYFITDKQPDCSGWATVKEEDDELVTIGCHETKQDAIDQMIAVSLAEDMEPGGERNLDGPAAIVVDIDETLFRADGSPIENVVAFVREYEGEVLIVTARRERRREETILQLESAGIEAEYLYMRDSAMPEVAYKSEMVRDLLDVWNIELAIENNPDVRAEYARLGITTLEPGAVDPAELPEMVERQQRAPAPAEDQIEGSDENAPGSASGAGGDIELSEATETALRNKAQEHNDAMGENDRPAWTRTTFGQLSAVYRRGAGAFSTSHRPGVSRGAWAMARVNAFLFLLRTGRPENASYVTDNDLLPEDHPRSTRSLVRAVDLSLPEYVREAARRGLEYYEAGRGGDGLVDRTIREARLMASGEVSEDKVLRVSAWAARHIVDLEASQNSDADDDAFPGAGAVAFYLWGIDPLDPEPAIAWFDRKAEQIREEEIALSRSMSVPTANLFLMENGVETRRICVNDFELRDADAGAGMTFVGYGAVFNSDSEPLPFIERIAPGAFSRSLRSRNEIKMFVNHDTTQVLASKRAGTLRLAEDSHGLRVEADLPDTTAGRDMAYLIKRGDVADMSFGFSVPSGGDSWSADGQTRELREVRLHEVSIVTGFPAYQATTASVRSLDGLVEATGLESDKLNAAIDALEKGETLAPDLAEVLDMAIGRLRSERDDVAASLALKQKQLDMLLARV